MFNSRQYKDVQELKNQIRTVIDCLDKLDDTTYDAVNGFDDSDHGGYVYLLDWLQYLSSLR